MHKLHLGTSSWAFPDWRSTFYPEGLASGDQLRYYASQFNSVEVNTSFYALPEPATVVQWVEAVPEGFALSLKAPRSITHEKRLVNCRDEIQAYLDVLRSLGPAAGPGFFQFPPSFSRDNYGRLLADFISWLGSEKGSVAVAVEVRSDDLTTPAFVRFLGQHGIAYVVVEREGTWDGFEAWCSLLEEGEIPGYLFLRLIGDDGRGEVTHDRFIQRPQEQLLDRWADRIAPLLKKGVHVYAYIHNPFEGHAPATVRRLRERIGQRHELTEWSPSMKPPADEGDHGQLSLF